MNKRFRPDDVPQDFGFLNGESDAPSDVVPNQNIAGTGAQSNMPPDVFPDEQSKPIGQFSPTESPQGTAATESPVPKEQTVPPSRPKRAKPTTPASTTTENVPDELPGSTASNGQGKGRVILIGYATLVTLLLIYMMLTSKSSRLESLPDIRPLKGNEFQQVPEGTKLPEGHVLKLGQATRFGDVVVTPTRITREPLKFENFMTKAADDSQTTAPVLKLHFTMKNVAANYAFPPFDSGLMSHRSPPESEDDTAKVNSFLLVRNSADTEPRRFLNFRHLMDNTFLLTGQNSARPVAPGETLDTFIASSVAAKSVTLEPDTKCTWRVQIRKGVNTESGNGVTTLIDVTFQGSDVQTL